MATKGSDEDSSDSISMKCCACAQENITKLAEKYCVECQDYYCVSCSSQHKRFPIMRGHTLLDKNDFITSKQKSTLPTFPTESCRVHKAKLLDLYCKNHDEVICTTCFAVKHRNCQDIHSIPDEIDSLYDNSEISKFKDQVDNTRTMAVKIKANRKHLLKKLSENKEKAVNEILEYKRELEKELKKLETNSLLKLDAKYEEIQSGLKADVKDIDEYLIDLDDSSNKLAELGGNKTQEFVCVKTAEKLVRAIEEGKLCEQDAQLVQLEFYPDEEMKEVITSRPVFGEIYRNKVYTVNKEREINVKLNDDTSDCWMFDSCFIPDDTLLLTDLNNKKLKRLQISSNAVTDSLKMETGPIAVCKLSTQEAAVSLTNYTIQFVSLGDKMAVTRTLKMDHYCCGLVSKDDKLFISYEGQSVYIHDIDGTMLNKVTTDKSGKPLFSEPRHISLSTNKDIVYVADYENGVIALDTQGNHLYTLADADISGTMCCCTDGRGHLFVCGQHSSKIVQFNEKLKTKICVIGTVKLPLSVSFVPNKNYLYVTSGNRDSITIFELT